MSEREKVISLHSNDLSEELEAESLELLRQALEDLRMEIRTLRTAPIKRKTGLEKIDWPGLFDTLRGHLSQIGMSERSLSHDDFGFDADVSESLTPFFTFLYERYWRVRFIEEKEVPSESPSLFVVNRSTLLPYDGLMLAHLLMNQKKYSRPIRFLVSDSLANQPFFQPWLARLGGVRVCYENVDYLLRSGHSVICFPEGDAGVLSPFKVQGELSSFLNDGAVAAALKNKAPIVPVGIAGADETYPLLATFLGVDPSPEIPFLPFLSNFPWLGILSSFPLPVQWVISFGAALEAKDFNCSDEDSVAQEQVHRMLRVRVEAQVEAAAVYRGSVESQF